MTFCQILIVFLSTFDLHGTSQDLESILWFLNTTPSQMFVNVASPLVVLSYFIGMVMEGFGSYFREYLYVRIINSWDSHWQGGRV